MIEPDRLLGLFLAGNIINTPSIMARCRSTLPILTRFNINWRYCQDWFYWLLLAVHGQRFYYSGESLHSYRFHESSLSQSPVSWAWRNVDPPLILLSCFALAAHSGELGLRCYNSFRIVLFANWLFRSMRFRQHPSWDQWAALAGLSAIRWHEWPRVAWIALRVFQQRRAARRAGINIHRLPSAFLGNSIFD
ncbi:hypothetical protein KBY82_03105 [Cyanobium sp. AMD-g]|uniref:hypothetical protein n=1 Tax=Cyanobium sp. AMD-g TaxID=2823699 RepID=UPI0037C12203|nr:hypothetical protein [Cyanobium sp. AMD-g]